MQSSPPQLLRCSRMFNRTNSHNSLPDQANNASDSSSQGAQLPVEQFTDSSWQTIHFPGTIATDQIPEPSSSLRTTAMDSSSQHLDDSTLSSDTSAEQSRQRETELLNLVRDLNECNDVLLAKVSELEESLERSQSALQAEIDRSGNSGDREIVQLVTELEQSNQSLQHQHVLNESLQTELAAVKEHANQLEAEHTVLVQQATEQSQALLQANASCRDLRARLQRQQRYTLQFKVALEKCLNVSSGAPSTDTEPSLQGLTMPKTDEIQPWEAALGRNTLDPQLESMIRGVKAGSQPTNTSTMATEAEDQLWHDLARVMGPAEAPGSINTQTSSSETSPEITEPSPWSDTDQDSSNPVIDNSAEEDMSTSSSVLSPKAAQILARVQAAKITSTADSTYLPAVTALSSPSPLVNPLKPQKRIGSLAAVDLPNFPRLKKQPPTSQT
ncbi:MAG: hypothetical protein AAF821_24825 [Cyanobacteria bacterium P01_D01_bin.156]